MADASYAQTNFLGGEVSAFAQGRFDLPTYRSMMKTCLNSIPIEQGACVRRPGTRFGQTTRGGNPGRLVKFDFQAASAYNMEFTDGFLRFFTGPALVTTNDDATVAAISAANPAVVQTSAAHGFTSGNQGFFKGLGTNNPLLQNRVFTITVTDGTHFSIADAVTAATIDGSTLGAFVSGTFARVKEIATAYTGGSWTNLRSVQTETTSFLLLASVAPQAITVATQPTSTLFATFNLAAAVFNDGPYLDPFTNGVQATPSATKGVITLALAFPAYDSGKAYKIGDFVTFTAVNYQSLIDQNVGNQPDTHPGQWAATSAGVAISPNGFVGGDVGRLVRLFSEPADWAVGTTYAINAIVSYNPSGLPGQNQYWQSLVNSNVGNVPGADTGHWSIAPQGAALWTWGKITALATQISQTLAGSVNIGDMTSGGNLAAAFDSVIVQAAASSAEKTSSGVASLTSYVGKDYHLASAQKIATATLIPSSDKGLCFGTYQKIDGPAPLGVTSIVVNLRAKASAPANSADGTLLATQTFTSAVTAPVSLTSSDQSTSWNYIWFEIIFTSNAASPIPVSDIDNAAAEVQFFNPQGSSSSGNAVSVEILGPTMPSTAPIKVWRLGVYSNNTGWPTCGTYSDGRLWLSGALPNRFDACYSNGIVGGTVNFAPTDQYGVVTAAHAISYTFNAPDTNPILWMQPDLQGILCGTKAGEWLIQAPTAGGLSPINIAARRVTRIGCANIEPRQTEHTTVFAQKFGRKIMEFFPDVFSGKFTAPHITKDSKHLTQGNVAELAYQQELAPIVWARVNGALVGWTYKRDTLMTSQGPTFAAGHRHTLGSGRTVESICVGPSTGGNLDALSMVTNDPATGIRHVEILTDIFDEGSAQTTAWFLDDAVQASSYTVSSTQVVVNGLWHLNGKTVSVFAGGLDRGDFTVANGSVTLTLDAANGLFTLAYVNSFSGAMPILVGFTYTSQGQLVRPATPQESGARNGPALGKKRRTHNFAMLLKDVAPYANNGAASIQVGTVFTDLKDVLLRDDAGNTLSQLSLFSGVHWDSLQDDYSYDSMLCWQITRPVPATVVAIEGMLQTSDV